LWWGQEEAGAAVQQQENAVMARIQIVLFPVCQRKTHLKGMVKKIQKSFCLNNWKDLLYFIHKLFAFIQQFVLPVLQWPAIFNFFFHSLFLDLIPRIFLFFDRFLFDSPFSSSCRQFFILPNFPQIFLTFSL
jgi:hypothetical protein